MSATATPETPAVRELSAAQRRAVESRADNLVVVAGAGSGKTRTLIERIRRLIDQGTPARSIAAITFTNAGADEVTSRLGQEIGYSGTLHGFCLRLIQRFGDLVGFHGPVTVVSEERAALMLDAAVKLMRCRATKEQVQCILALGPVMLMRVRNPNATQLAAAQYFRSLRTANLVTFDTILDYGLLVLDKQPGALPVDGLTHLFVDEYQDSGHKDELIYDALAIPSKTFVGDADQCQPSGTMIEMADGTQKPIYQLSQGDAVRSYCRHSKAIIKSAKVTAVSKRPYAGLMYSVTADGKTTDATENHRWLIKWASGTDRKTGTYCTYIMRKGLHFRVGKTKFFRSAGADTNSGRVIGVASRMLQEGADSVWVLRVHKTDADATAYEQIVSASYGLPEACFTASYGCKGFTQEVIDRIFAEVPNQLRNAAQCLQDHGRLLDYPIIASSNPRTRRTVQEVRSCNLLPEVMSVPVADGEFHYKKRGSRWAKIQVERREFSGPVWSIDVEKHHKYIANGLVTCNSIYSFRGGKIGNLVHRAEHSDETILIEGNYRCGEAICRAAQRLIEHNSNRIHKETRSLTGQPGSVEVVAHAGDAAELAWLAQAAAQDGSLAILTRKSALAGTIAQHLRGLGIQLAERRRPDVPQGWGRAKALLAHWNDPANDTTALWLAVELMGEAAANRLALECKASCKALGASLGGAVPFDRALDGLSRRNVPEAAVERLRAILDGGHVAGYPELLLAIEQADQATEEVGSGVHVGTVHSAKGKEWSTVVLAGFEDEEMLLRGADEEEERRVCYVGMTRARERLVLSGCMRRWNPWTRASEPRTFCRFGREAVGA